MTVGLIAVDQTWVLKDGRKVTFVADCGTDQGHYGGSLYGCDGNKHGTWFKDGGANPHSESQQDVARRIDGEDVRCQKCVNLTPALLGARQELLQQHFEESPQETGLGETQSITEPARLGPVCETIQQARNALLCDFDSSESHPDVAEHVGIALSHLSIAASHLKLAQHQWEGIAQVSASLKVVKTMNANLEDMHRRRLAARFLGLPYRIQIQIIKGLNLFDPSEPDFQSMRDEVLFLEAFKRANEKGLLPNLWDELNAQ